MSSQCNKGQSLQKIIIAISRFLQRYKCNFLNYYVCICFRRRYTSRAFILPVLIFTFLYNLPKFFELYVKENPITKVVECIDVIDEPNVYSKYLKNCTEDSISNITIPDFGKDHLLLKLAINGLILEGKIDISENNKYYRLTRQTL